MKSLAHSLRQFTAAVLIPLATSNIAACYSWRAVDPATPQRLEPEAEYRINPLNGKSQPITNLTVHGDSLFGRQSTGSRKDTNVAFSLHDVRSLERRSFDAANSTVAIGFAAAITIVVGGKIKHALEDTNLDTCIFSCRKAGWP